MTGTARLIPVTMPPDPAGLVVVLHGGAARRDTMVVSPTQLSVLRMIPVARQISAAGAGQLAVVRLLNSYRGWNSQQTPVQDARWALDEMNRRLGRRLPACLVGHSLGGRAALLALDGPEVVSAVALAPWVYPTDDAEAAGRRVLIVHGTEDRIARPQKSLAVARSLSRTAVVRYGLVDGGKHAMLRHHREFGGLTGAFCAASLLGGDTDAAIAGVLGAPRWLEL